MIRLTELNAGILLWRLSLVSRCENARSKQGQKNRDGAQKEYDRNAWIEEAGARQILFS